MTATPVAAATATAVAAAYDASAATWATGPSLLYDALAAELIARCPVSLAGRRVLDLGAGTGAVARAAGAVGAKPVALDIAASMLAGCEAPRLVADAARLPLCDGAVGAVLAGFSLTHTEDPSAVLAEAARVTAAGGAVVVSAFDRRAPDHPAKAAVDGVVVAHGWRPPPWYVHLKEDTELRLSTPDGLVAAARAAGLDGRVTELTVSTGIRSAADVVAWRLGLAHVAPWLATLDAGGQALVMAAARAAVGPAPAPVRPAILILICALP